MRVVGHLALRNLVLARPTQGGRRAASSVVRRRRLPPSEGAPPAPRAEPRHPHGAGPERRHTRAATRRARLAPLGDRRVGRTLLTTLLVFTGLFTVYSYIAESLDRATGGDGTTLAALLFVWGVASTVGTLGSGALVDRLGARRIINTSLLVLVIDFALLPWSSANLATFIVALVVWGVCGWGLLTP
ncbi:MFS transporter [Actinacidiphila glaucinigra]|uniref:MFS transporter n=1 Tax=Actinacidiphila glaucinigra TaxID=235986 RepID=UPI0033D7453F